VNYSLSVQFTAEDLQEVDRIFDGYFASGLTPGLVYGVTLGDNLIHTRAVGIAEIDGSAPTTKTTFRVASLTKSFSAATVILLRDRGMLSLETPISRYLPELKDLRAPFFNTPEIHSKMLLSMSAGLPPDNEWADRLEQVTDDEFREILQTGVRFDSRPGTRYGYSNLGYAILARLIHQITGTNFVDFVTHEFLEPLALSSTTFDFKNAKDLATGYVMRDGWEPEGFTGPGAFSSIGGLITNLDDLAIWSGYLSEAFDPSASERGPLCKASRREMQEIQQVISEIGEPDTELSYDGVNGYGFGLRIEEDRNFGKIVGHSGGYPGYGSHMCWHTQSRIGVIAFANGRYAVPAKACVPALKFLLSKAERKKIEPLAECLVLQKAVNRLLSNWDDGLADQIFAFNMDLDHPRAYRSKRIKAALEEIGGLKGEAEISDIKSENASHLSWKITGNKGNLLVEIGLTPNLPAKLQVWKVLPIDLL
jgi:CubicO group peptidase (beta-lactamase class C family)